MDSPFTEYLPSAEETKGLSYEEKDYENPFVDNYDREASSEGSYESENPEEHEFADSVEGRVANESQDSGFQSGEASMDYQVASLPLVATTVLPKTSEWHKWFPGTSVSPAEPLVDGKSAFTSIVNAIKTATNQSHYIYILGWTMEVDWDLIPGTNQTLYSLLREASTKEVEIRMLVWDNIFDSDTIKEVNNAYKKINGLLNGACIKDNVTFSTQKVRDLLSKVKSMMADAPSILNKSDGWKALKERVNALKGEGSHHEKIVIVKGEKGLIGFCGGMDFNPNRVFNPYKVKEQLDSRGRSRVYHDVHCKVMGQAARDLLSRFLLRWKALKGVISHPALSKTLRGEAEPPTVTNPQPASVYNANVKIIHTYNNTRLGLRIRSVRDSVRVAIAKAKRTIYVEDQYMISLEIADWLNAKIKDPSFQNVTILTQDDDIAKSDIQFPKQMRDKFMTHLLKGVTMAEIAKGKVLVYQLERTYPPLSHHKVHSKIYIIDDELAIVGSANCSSRSMTFDTETAALIFSEPGQKFNFAKEMRTLIKTDREINPVPYRPNPNIQDRDEEIKSIIGSVAKGALLMSPIVAGPLLPMVPIAFRLLAVLKPLVIDVLDPDADDTQPQQEIEENLFEGFTGYETAAMSDNYYQMEEDVQQYAPEETESFPDATSETPFNAQYNIAEAIEQQVATVKTTTPAKPVEGHISWAKSVLNQLGGLNLSPDNRLDAATKKAIRDFQSANGLIPTERIDFATERVLLEVDALRRHKGTAKESVSVKLIGTAKIKILDWTVQAEKVRDKPEILNAFRDPRKLWAFVLHHMAFKRKNPKTGLYSDPLSYQKVGAHFCIMFDGKIVQLHPLSRMIWHSNCTSPRSIGVEFEGNFPNVNGKWWIPRDPKDKTKFIKFPDKDKPTPAQLEAGRFLACYLQTVLGTTSIYAHRQSSKDRENDPGPDVWFNVGQWAVDNLGMTDGGPGFKCGDGFAIEPKWRTWGSTAPTNVTKEYGEEEGHWEGEYGESDEAPVYEDAPETEYAGY